jgi:ADP-L-glycero-D-manno-heptose 6-epimerase
MNELLKTNKIDFNNKSILITGGAGFIGSNLVFYLQNNFPDSKIIVFDAFRNNETFENGNLKSFGHFNNLIGFSGDIVCGNINNKKDLALLDKYNFDFIFHHAAISDTRVHDQEEIMRTNVNSFYDLLEIAKKNQSTLVYASSAATYGNLPAPQRIGKEMPENAYGYSKYIMDQIAIKFANNNPDLKIIGLRFFNVFGPREFYKGTTSSMIIQLGHQILDEKPPRLFENSSAIFRDFIYIDDVIQANIKACESIKSGVFNVGSGIKRSFQEISDILQKVFNKKLGNVYFPNPYSGYQTNTQADISDTRKCLGFEPNYTLEDGIAAYKEEIIRMHGSEIT